MKVLLTGAEGDIAEAVCRIICESYPDALVHGSDLSGDPWPLTAGYSRIHRLPRGDAAAYLDEVRQLQRRERFDRIIPLTGPELARFAGEATLQIPLVMVRRDLVLAFLDKLETVRWLQERGLPAPDTMALEDATAGVLPLIAKPRAGHGSRGLRVVRTAQQLAAAKAEAQSPMVAQALLADDDAEFTCGVFRHAASREIRTIVFRRRLVGGLTGRARVEEHDSITSMLRTLATCADLDGSVNVQLRLTPDGPSIFEINPRFSSTVMMRHRLGFQDVVWSFAGLRGMAPPPYVAPVGTRVFRLSREIVVTEPRT
jgi:carbamoyl-phosphate synthase large subunit